MLLIDADNVSADVISQAVERVLQEHGAIHVRRAYCTAESALANLKLFKAHSIRPMINLSTGKNSTDIALAVDAIDLVVAERPHLVVLVSSDSDFAPLVIRLREKGCRVEGIGQEGKTGDDSKPVYDAFVDLPHRKGAASARAPARSGGRTAAARRASGDEATRGAVHAAPVRGESVVAPARLPGTERAARRPRGVPKVAVQPPAAPPAPRPLPDDVQRILHAVPVLQGGARLELGIAAERLRAAGLLAKNAASTKLFKKHSTLFALTPETQPNKVQYLGPPLS
jgi:uncharacterized protein (TIGR00288 family)